jgi:hypothetical protein
MIEILEMVIIKVRQMYQCFESVGIHLIRILIQNFRLNTVPIRIRSGSKVLMTKKLEKIRFFGIKKLQFTFSLGLHKGRPSYRRSLQLSKENIQHFKI